MNKVSTSVLLLGICLLLQGGNIHIHFRFNGYQKNMSYPGMTVSAAHAEKVPHTMRLSERLDYLSHELYRLTWELEKSACDKNRRAFADNVLQLHECLATIHKGPDPDLMFSACYPLVLESAARILQSSSESMMTEQLLRSCLGMEYLNSKNCRHLYTFAKMLILNKKMLQYRKIHGYFPQSLSQLATSREELLDGWREEILLTVKANDFFLSSNCGANLKKVNIFEYVPIFSRNNCNGAIVFSNTMPELRRQLWSEGCLKIGEMNITLDKNCGTTSYYRE